MLKQSLLFIIMLLPLLVKAQPDTSGLQIGIGSGIGIFCPEAVNNYISNYIEAHDIEITSGTSDLFLNYSGNVSSSYIFKNHIGIKAKLEFAIAPKSIYVTNDDADKTFIFWRFSPGLFASYTIPITKEIAIIPEAGLFYHMMRFENIHANKTCPRFQLNMNFFNNRTIRIEGTVGLDLAKANTNNAILKSLDYSGVIIATGVYWQL
jgi:hypothetical protein